MGFLKKFARFATLQGRYILIKLATFFKFVVRNPLKFFLSHSHLFFILGFFTTSLMLF